MAGGYGNNEHFKTSVTSLPSFTEFTSSLRLRTDNIGSLRLITTPVRSEGYGYGSLHVARSSHSTPGVPATFPQSSHNAPGVPATLPQSRPLGPLERSSQSSFSGYPAGQHGRHSDGRTDGAGMLTNNPFVSGRHCAAYTHSRCASDLRYASDLRGASDLRCAESEGCAPGLYTDTPQSPDHSDIKPADQLEPFELQSVPQDRGQARPLASDWAEFGDISHEFWPKELSSLFDAIPSEPEVLQTNTISGLSNFNNYSDACYTSNGGYSTTSSSNGGYSTGLSTNKGYSTASSSNMGYSTASSSNGGYSTASSSNMGYSKASSSNGEYSKASSLNGGYSTTSSSNMGYSKASSSNRGYSKASSSNMGYSTASSLNGGYSTASSSNGGYSTASSLNGGYSTASSLNGGYSKASSLNGGYSTISISNGGYSTLSGCYGSCTSTYGSTGGYTGGYGSNGSYTFGYGLGRRYSTGYGSEATYTLNSFGDTIANSTQPNGHNLRSASAVDVMYPWYDYKPSLMSSEFSMDTDFENCGVTSTTDDPLLKMPSLSNEKSSFDHVSSTSDSTEKDSTRLENEDFDSKYNFVISKESRRAADEPRRPKNSFIRFSVENRFRIAKEHPLMDNREVSKILGNLWKMLTPEQKKPYEIEFSKDMEAIRNENPDWQYVPTNRLAAELVEPMPRRLRPRNRLKKKTYNSPKVYRKRRAMSKHTRASATYVKRQTTSDTCSVFTQVTQPQQTTQSSATATSGARRPQQTATSGARWPQQTATSGARQPQQTAESSATATSGARQPQQTVTSGARRPQQTVTSGARQPQQTAESSATATSGVRQPLQTATSGVGERREEQTWVQCDVCYKWRRLPHAVHPSQLPDVWLCELNPDLQYKSCLIPEEFSN